MIFARNSVTLKEKKKLRGVWGKPFDLLIAEASIYLPWIERMQRMKTVPNGYKYTMFHRGYRKLWDELMEAAPPGRHTYVMLDFSKYDTSLAPWLLRRCREIVDAQIDFGSYEHWGKPVPERSYRLARRLFKATIDTEFIMPDGYVWKKDYGTDSGSLMFQRDEDIATYVIGRYVCARMRRICKFIRVLGDDIIMAVEGRHTVHLEELAQICESVFGMEVSMDKSYVTTDIREVSFLGRYFSFGHPRRDTVDIVFAALYPKQTDRSDFDVAQRIVALMFENCFANATAQKFLTHCWNLLPLEVRDYCTSGAVPWSPKWLKIFRSYGLEKPPKVAPPTFDYIFHLLETPDGSYPYHPGIFVQ
jgi:hypothetical protein